MGPKISIIVPVYNVSAYIRRCVNSVASQTYKNIEVIFVDDCGSDDSVLQVEDFIANIEIECLLLRHDHNRGLSAVRNSALDAATGDYVFFLDSDDEITNNCIELLVNPLKRYAYDVVIGNYITVGGVTECELRLNPGPILGNNKIMTEFLDNRWYAMAWNKLYRTQFIRENQLRFKEGCVHEDELWSFQVALCAESMYAITAETYKYLINPTSIMATMTYTNHYNSWAIILSEMLNSARVHNKDSDYNVFNYIETLKSDITCEAYKHLTRNDFREYYDLLSKARWEPLKFFLKKRLPLKRALKDLCFYLPNKLAYIYLVNWYKLTLRPAKKDILKVC